MEAKNPFDGTTYRFADGVDFEHLSELNRSCKTDEEYERWIDNLEDVSAAMKNALKALIKHTVTVGKIILKIGKIVLGLLMKLLFEYPNTIAGILFGFVLGVLYSTIPFFGWALGPVVMPLFMVGGGIAGFLADISSKLAASGAEARIRSSLMDEIRKMGVNI